MALSATRRSDSIGLDSYSPPSWPRNDGVNSGPHLQILKSIQRGSEARYSRKVDDFLDELFDNTSPLRCAGVLVTTTDGRSAVLVTFALNEETNLTFQAATILFCNKIFTSAARRLLGFLSEKSVLGLSPVSQLFKHYWNRELFGAISRQGPTLLNTINDAYSDYLPSWALLVNFAVVSRNQDIFSSLRSALSVVQETIEVLGPLGISISCLCLERFIEYNKNQPTRRQEEDIQRRWNLYKTKLRLVIAASARFQEVSLNPALLSNDEADPEFALYEALFSATEEAARMFTMNSEIWRLFKEACVTSVAQSVLNGIGAGMGFLALDAAAEAAGTAALVAEGTAVVAASAIAAPIALGLLAVNAGLLVKNVMEAMKNARKAEKHKQMDLFIKAAWKNTHWTTTCLHWVRNTDGSGPGGVIEFVSDQARLDWEAFITQVRIVSGQPVLAAHRDPQFLVAFVEEQRRRLADLLENLPLDLQDGPSRGTDQPATAELGRRGRLFLDSGRLERRR